MFQVITNSELLISKKSQVGGLRFIKFILNQFLELSFGIELKNQFIVKPDSVTIIQLVGLEQDSLWIELSQIGHNGAGKHIGRNLVKGRDTLPAAVPVKTNDCRIIKGYDIGLVCLIGAKDISFEPIFLDKTGRLGWNLVRLDRLRFLCCGACIYRSL